MAEDIQIKVEGDSSVFRAKVYNSNDRQIRSAPPGRVVTVPFSFRSEPYVKIEKVGSKDITGVEVEGTINEDYGYIKELEFTREMPFMADPFWKGVLSSKVEGTYRGHVITIKPQYAGAGGSPEDLNISLTGDTDKVRFEVWRDGSKHADFTGGVLDWVEGVSIQLRAYPETIYSISGITGLDFTDAGDYWYCDITEAVEEENRGETITLDISTSNTSLDNIEIDLVGDPDSYTAKLYEIETDSYVETLTVGGKAQVPFSFSNPYYLQIEEKGNFEISGIDVSDNAQDISNKTPLVFEHKTSFQQDRWVADFDTDIENTYRGRVIEITPSVEEAEPPITVRLTSTAEPSSAELYVDDVYDRDIPYDENVNIPYEDGKLKQIRVYSAKGMEIAEIEVAGEADHPSYRALTFAPDAGGESFYFANITDQVAKHHGNNLVNVAITAIVETNTVSPFNRLHLVDESKAQDLSKQAMEPILGFENQFADKSVYIINMLWLPFKIPVSLVGADISVRLGDFKTDVKAPIVRSDSIPVNLGEIKVPDEDISSLDYETNSFDLVLPFVENTISLEPSKIYGKTIRADFVVDAYNGDLTINVYNGGDQPIVTQSGSVGRSIPIKTLTDSVGALGAASGVSNSVFTAFIRETKTETLESQYTNLVLKSGALGDASGYVEVENVDLNFSATSQEKADIEGWLTTGVMMK